MNAIDIMKDEHASIKEMLKVLGAYCQRLEKGDEVDLDDGAAMIEFFQVFADKFHHEKEEQLIFPLMEKELDIPKAGGPVEVMLEDHSLGRTDVRGMAEALERLRGGDRDAVSSFASSAKSYIYLLNEHIKTEDDAIFDMVEMRLPEERLEQLRSMFATVEKTSLGATGRQTFLDLIDRLKLAYLS